MGILTRVIDKILFAVLFIVALQVPILADHYRQYLAGYYDATADQVAQYQALAKQFGYDSVETLIKNLQNNSDKVVREDAKNKAEALLRLSEIQTGIDTLEHGQYYTQAIYMFSPARKETLLRVLDNFSPSVPLTPSAVVLSLLTAIILNLVLVAPLWTARRVHHWRRQRKERIRYS